MQMSGTLNVSFSCKKYTTKSSIQTWNQDCVETLVNGHQATKQNIIQVDHLLNIVFIKEIFIYNCLRLYRFIFAKVLSLYYISVEAFLWIKTRRKYISKSIFPIESMLFFCKLLQT